MMKKTIILSILGLLTTCVLSQELSSVCLPPFPRGAHTHAFNLNRGPVSINARIYSRNDLADFFVLEYKGVNICFYDFDQVQDFYLALKSVAEGTPTPSSKVRANGTWCLSSVSEDRFEIWDVARNHAKLKEKHLNYIIEGIELINRQL